MANGTRNPKGTEDVQGSTEDVQGEDVPVLDWDTVLEDDPSIGVPQKGGKGGKARQPLAAILDNPIRHACDNPRTGIYRAAINSVSTEDIIRMHKGGTYPVLAADGTPTGSTVTYAALPFGMIAYALGHKARQDKAILRGRALWAAASAYGTVMLARVTELGTEDDDNVTTRTARAFALDGTRLPLEDVRRAAAGEAYVYESVQEDRKGGSVQHAAWIAALAGTGEDAA